MKFWFLYTRAYGLEPEVFTSQKGAQDRRDILRKHRAYADNYITVTSIEPELLISALGLDEEEDEVEVFDNG